MRQKKTNSLSMDPFIKNQIKGVRFFWRLHVMSILTSLTDVQMRQQLIFQFNLSTEKKEKPIMRAKDLFEFFKTLWVSKEIKFNHERHRVQLILIMQFAEITDNRLNVLLALRYKHIKVTLLSDPKDKKQSRMLIEIRYEHTKNYLNEKDAWVFLI